MALLTTFLTALLNGGKLVKRKRKIRPKVEAFFQQDDEESSSYEETSSQSSQSPTMGSPSRFGSCRDLSPESKIFSRQNSATRSRTPSPAKTTSSAEAASTARVSSPLRSAEKKSAEVSVHLGDDDYDDDDDSGNFLKIRSVQW